LVRLFNHNETFLIVDLEPLGISIKGIGWLHDFGW
jgi:hypothetical protein